MKYNLSILILALASPAFAAPYALDKDHSSVDFTVRHVVSKQKGSFRKFDGSFEFDAKTNKATNIKFNIDASSVFTDNEKRDEHLKSPDFFDVATHKELTFVGKDWKPAGKGKFKLSGDLTIRGVTKPATFDVEYLGAGKDPWGNDKVGFSAVSKIKRQDFGVSWNKMVEKVGVVGDEVSIAIQIEANQVKADAAKK
ncbi:MAG: polyisoprenoid-binding protein [Bdellovibrionales bacterium]|nr:polyisoprenoid-binding protein [Bdellovibrionales bacterium]